MEAIRWLSRSPRRWMAGAITTLIAVVASHGFAACLRVAFDVDAQAWAPGATRLSLMALLLGAAVSSLERFERKRALLSVLLGGLATLAMMPFARWPTSPALALLFLAPCLLWAHQRVLALLPVKLDTDARRRRGRAVSIAFLMVLGIVQIARLSTYMTNPESSWFLGTSEPFYAKHECANAYVYAVELHERGEPNIYDPSHYPGLNPQAEPHTEMKHMAVEDPFQYPPPFLILPAFARWLTGDYAAIRVVWFGLNVLLCLTSVLSLAWFIGKKRGYAVALWSPLLLVAFPVLHNFQYGQFHFAAIALSILGMIALERGRRVWGGALLAFGILSKVFPVLLLIYLFVRGRFRDAAFVVGAILVFVAVSLVSLGPEPFLAFFLEHLPRLKNGAAFAFGDAWPEVADLVLAGNQGVAGVMEKLEYWNVSVPAWVIQAGHWGLLGMVLSVFVLANKRVRSWTSYQSALLWLATLGFGSLLSRGAWSDYVPLTSVWLLTVLFASPPGGVWLRWLLYVCAVFQLTLVGTMPWGPYQDPSWLMPVSLVSAALLWASFSSGMVLALKGTPQTSPSRVSPLSAPVADEIFGPESSPQSA